ncbi:hypothetical protein Vretifemale_11970 [Volvox reticuliferus]|uniref:Transcription factor TFIIB cyclin-like domain-containing protein n=1 Tax=Volvox reticuliferus TaxID=1737510 RepID=A0A8J4CJL6_9CHLO|nr:hypothetical protein Vretifemale_11970 [Volvox reticuliferus]
MSMQKLSGQHKITIPIMQCPTLTWHTLLSSQAKSLKGRSVKALAASCLFWACRQEKQARTFKEIVAVLGNDVSKKEIGRCFKDLQQIKKDELQKQGASADALASTMNQTVQHPAEFVRNYCNQLRLEFKCKKLAEEIAQNAKPADRRVPWDGRTPTSIASAIVFIAMVLWEVRMRGKSAMHEGAERDPVYPPGNPDVL